MIRDLVGSHPLILVFLVCLIHALYWYLIYPLFISPFRKIPGPFFLRISHIPSLHYQRTGQWNNKIYHYHQVYKSDVIVVGPNELSFNKPSYMKDIYVKNFPKSKFYANFGNHGHDNIFSTIHNKEHLLMKKKVSGIYSKSSILGSWAKIQCLNDCIGLLVDDIFKTSVTGVEPDLDMASGSWNELGKGYKEQNWLRTKGGNIGMEMYSLFSALAMDVVTSFELGPAYSANLLINKKKRRIIGNHRLQSSMGFYTTLLPKFWNWAASTKIKEACIELEDWQLKMYAEADSKNNISGQDQFEPTLKILARNGISGKQAYSLLSDNIFAGHETTAIQLTYLTYELSRPKNFSVQQKLIKELLDAFGYPPNSAGSDLAYAPPLDLEVVDKLQYLEAIIQENLRIHASIPGPEPRLTNKLYPIDFTINKTEKRSIVVPENTVVSVQPWCVHRDDEIFPSPDDFIPERWLKTDDESEDEFKRRILNQRKHMMAFGQGVRMCLGMSLALLEIKLTVASLYWRYNSKLCEDWCDITPPTQAKCIQMKSQNYKPQNNSDEEKMVMVDSYTTRPLQDECWLKWYIN